MRLALSLAMPAVAFLMILLAIPVRGRAKSFMENSAISVLYITTILALSAFGMAYLLRWLLSTT